ncbi:hypothetical protein [Umezawaea beigongshangensis]|uniref:hypothetical protein n=1 Tax=Umezawaea beigongshangensis TaxID=2780383 RepID=UPI0018F1B829|nr:hypothetical protein [Umezawaea beigongshangensis]
MSGRPTPRDRNTITDTTDLADALIEAFVNGDPATSQHIVDTLGERATRTGQAPR